MAHRDDRQGFQFGSSATGSRDWYFPSSFNTESIQRSPVTSSRFSSTFSSADAEQHLPFRPIKSQRTRAESSIQRNPLFSGHSFKYGDRKSDNPPSHGHEGGIQTMRRRRQSTPPFQVHQVLQSESKEENLPPSHVQKSCASKGSNLVSCKQWPSYFLSFNTILLFVTCFLSLLYALSLHEQLMVLEEEIVKLKKACNMSDILHYEDVKLQENDPSRERGIRNFALCVVLFFLLMPFLFLKFVDVLPKLNRASKYSQGSEEVPLSKRIAYRVDVFFSICPYAKPLALLLATVLLIGVGGLALLAVSDDSIWDALWMSWTFVADSGNHTSSVGTGPRIVSVSISLGGMLIFAMMLGLVSDAISEKVDSLRKGKSEVIENNHTLILGWSDKLAPWFPGDP
eukprot:Gb_31318 [translate_table: standard]